MSVLGLLIPVSLFLGGLGLAAFIWSMKTRQFEDPEGDEYRALFGRDDAEPPSKSVAPGVHAGLHHPR